MADSTKTDQETPEQETSKSKASKPQYVDRTLGCRYELKYIVSEATAIAIDNFIKPHMPVDRFSKLQPDGYYPIVSLYLDSMDYRLCRESLTGEKNRFKLRIRSYSDDTQYPTFFEIKRRINTTIMKSRAPARHEDIAPLLRGLSLPKEGVRTNIDALNQFQFYCSAIMAKPAILIRYLRKAYEEDTENRVRITFDRELCYRVSNEPKVELNGEGWRHSYTTMEGVILEIKFTSRFPLWLTRLVRTFNLKARSVSKFTTSIQQSSDLGFCGPLVR